MDGQITKTQLLSALSLIEEVATVMHIVGLRRFIKNLREIESVVRKEA